MRTINVTLDEASIQAAIDELERYEQGIVSAAGRAVESAAKQAAEVAQAGFSAALYAGENDVRVSAEQRDKNEWAVVASGNAALFIEFGTGIAYDEDHPEVPVGVLHHGEYGKGKAARTDKDGSPLPWEYYGEPGTAGWPVGSRTKNGKSVQLSKTLGNPAGMCLYKAQVWTEDHAAQIFEEALKDG